MENGGRGGNWYRKKWMVTKRDRKWVARRQDVKMGIPRVGET